MSLKFPHAQHLFHEEVDYELSIRNRKDDLKLSLEDKQDILKSLFRLDAAEKRDYAPLYPFNQDYDVIAGRVNSIRMSLAVKADAKQISRLKHYLMRAQRCIVTGEEVKIKDMLVQNIKELLASQGVGTNAGKNTTKTREIPEEAEHSSSEGEDAEGAADNLIGFQEEHNNPAEQSLLDQPVALNSKQSSSKTQTTSKTGTIPKTSNPWSNWLDRNENQSQQGPSQSEWQAKVDALEQQVTQLKELLKATLDKTCGDQLNRGSNQLTQQPIEDNQHIRWKTNPLLNRPRFDWQH